jgi:hypothetical protein
MIRCHVALLRARCHERGYTLEEVMDCVVSQDGDYWVVDTSSPAYPKSVKTGYVQKPFNNLRSGCLAGAELKKLLAGFPFFIKGIAGCACNARAHTMDARGCDWCEENIDTIVGWLREEATKRGIPFLDAAGRLLVRRAIRNARRAAS